MDTIYWHMNATQGVANLHPSVNLLPGEVMFIGKVSSTLMMRPSQGFFGTGKRGIYFRGTGKQRPNFEGNRVTNTILGKSDHKKTNFRFLGNRGTSQFISEEQRNRYPHGE